MAPSVDLFYTAKETISLAIIIRKLTNITQTSLLKERVGTKETKKYLKGLQFTSNNNYNRARDMAQ